MSKSILQNSNYGQSDPLDSPVNEYYITDFGVIVPVKESIFDELEKFAMMMDSVTGCYPNFYPTPKVMLSFGTNKNGALLELLLATDCIAVVDGEVVGNIINASQHDALDLLKTLGKLDGKKSK